MRAPAEAFGYAVDVRTVTLAMALWLAAPGLLLAQAPGSAPAADGRAGRVPVLTPPPSPAEHEPVLLVDVYLGLVTPLERSDICPGGASCVLGGGAVVGGEIERRWAFGLGIFLGYEAWFVESGGVFELGTAQLIRAGLRFSFLESQVVHPAIHVGAGAMVFGDALFVSTVGGALDLGATTEIELTDSVAATVGAKTWLFTTGPFTTRDEVERSQGAGINVALMLSVGLSILADAGTDPVYSRPAAP